MKRLNHTLLLATAVTICVTGCSSGKLRNLLSRNEYQTLEEQTAEPSGLPGEAKTQVVSAESDQNDSFFKLPRFLGGKDDGAEIAPDPFATTDDPSVEASIKAYQARVDERIARQAQSANKTLSDVEQQARELMASAQGDASNPFEDFADRKSDSQSEEVASSPSDTGNSVFEEMFGQQPTAEENEVASPLIAGTTPKSSGFSQPEQTLSEFDKLLQAHEQQEATQQPSISIEPGAGEFDDLVAETSNSFSGSEDSSSTFGNPFAFNESSDVADEGSDFEEFMNSKEAAVSNNDVWGQLDEESTSEDVFAAITQTEQTSSEEESVFTNDFAQTASNHGFAEESNPWENINSTSGFSGGIDVAATEFGMSSSGSPLEQSPTSREDFESHQTGSFAEQSAFVPVSQSSPVSSGQTSPGLIIPASESNAVFEFGAESSNVQQISASTSVDGLPTIAATNANQPGGIPALAADSSDELAVQSQVPAEGWSRRTLFLIIGCVLIAGLLFLPERQKR